MDDGYVSDAMSATTMDSVSVSVSGTPQSPTFGTQVLQLPVSSPLSLNGKGKGRAIPGEVPDNGEAPHAPGGPIIVSLEEGEALPFGDEDVHFGHRHAPINASVNG